MRIVTLPGVFRPISDSWLLAESLREQRLGPGTSVLDVCTGSGALAVCAARAGAGRVTAVDVSRRSVATAWINARLNGASVRALRSDLFSALGDERYDVIASNPPYVPHPRDEVPTRGRRRAWDAGRDGRAVLDRLIAEAPGHLHDGGTLLVVHSEICGTEATLDAMATAGLSAEVLTRHRGPLGPLMRERVDHLRAQGALAAGQTHEEVVVIAGRRARPAAQPSPATAAAAVPTFSTTT
ncbi:MAG TPA: HemK2/MTQ2 family protein methyltransferase [Baekduia sp.]|jgi:release factor glutamine methyltransferase|nr:HemK2/MTQ2 family protein methyltransferase [Baekduia sp.]